MQLLLFLAVAFLIVFGLYAKKSALSKKAKVGLGVAFALLALFSWWYEGHTRENTEHNRLLISAFKQGKTLYCDGREISSATFVFVSGTLSFIANDKNKNDKGVVIDMVTCKLEH
ncbi:hypothetical protein [Sulfurospirillum sp.]|jgi:hypothetical protein|uniref:hypothetical protein n=1 Tax=Sulfurospirillum sp. TaxID=2053622 RepID=UPI002FDE3A07